MQPTPRWDLHAGTVVLNVDHYTLLKHAVLRVKGVPMFYLPILYYPTKREDRATGFLHPDLRIVDAARPVDSQRVLLGDQPQPGRDDHARLVFEDRTGRRRRVPLQPRQRRTATSAPISLDQHEATYAQPDGTPIDYRRSAATRSAAAPTRRCPVDLRARGERQLLLEHRHARRPSTRNIYDASRNSRSYGGNVVGAWGKYTMNATLDHSEYFYRHDALVAVREAGRASSFARNERPMLGLAALFLGRAREYVSILRDTDERRDRVETTTPA